MIALSLALAYLGTLAAGCVVFLVTRKPSDLANRLDLIAARCNGFNERIEALRQRLSALDDASASKVKSEGAEALELARALMERWKPAAEDMAEMRKVVNRLAIEKGWNLKDRKPAAQTEPAQG